MKRRSWLVALGVVLALGLGFAMAAPAKEDKPEVCFDKARCAEYMNFGREAFNRGKFNEAKGFFRVAVSADPSSAKAWAYYDLSVMYDVAEQVKKAGSVKVSGAPLLGPAAAQPAAAPAAGQSDPPAKAAPPAPASSAPPGIPVIKEDEGC